MKTFEIDEQVKLQIDDSGPEDFGASGLVINSSDGRFGSWANTLFYYMGEIKELPEWCVISTTKNKTSSTKDFMVRKDKLIKTS